MDFSDGHLWDVFRMASTLPVKVRINIHSEDAEIVMTESARVRELGLEGLPAWSKARPGASEAIAIQTVAYLSRRFGVPVYFPHIGSREAIEALVDVKAKGTNYGAEVGPQYVALTTEIEAGTLAKVMPPVRTAEDVARVWWAIREGILTSFGSDHIAYTLEEKSPGSIWTTRPAFGGTGMILPIFLSEGVNGGHMTIRQVAEIGSLNTARLFNLYPRKGTLEPGADGDFVIVDLDREWTVKAGRQPEPLRLQRLRGPQAPWRRHGRRRARHRHVPGRQADRRTRPRPLLPPLPDPRGRDRRVLRDDDLSRLAVIPGDGVGREVIPEGLRVLRRAGEVTGSFSIETRDFPWSCEFYTQTGRMMPADGSPSWPTATPSTSARSGSRACPTTSRCGGSCCRSGRASTST